MSDEYEITPFDAPRASEQAFAAWTELSNLIRAEAWPDDPPQSVERVRTNMLSAPEYVEVCRWTVLGSGGRLAASASTWVWNTGQNEHAGGFEIDVHPDHRRRGLATRLLAPVAAALRQRGRRLFLVTSFGSVPSAAGFLRALGAAPGLEEETLQLDLRELDRGLLRAWQERGRERAGDFEIGAWIGPYPVEAYEEVVAMRRSHNLMPRGDLQVDDEESTVEQVRQSEAAQALRKDERWCLYARDPASGQIAGFTEVWWHPESPEVLSQSGTAVFPEFQGRGLGRLLKAMMLERVLRDRPQVRRVRTSNAYTNAPMLKINQELGFKPYQSRIEWQVETEKVEEYLNGRAHFCG